MRNKSKGFMAMLGAVLTKPDFNEQADRRERADVYVAKPSREPVDLAELRRNLMQRFSKTLAELAK